MTGMNAVYAERFSARPPARTTVPGADWGRPDILIEIEAIAVRRQRRLVLSQKVTGRVHPPVTRKRAALASSTIALFLKKNGGPRR